MTLLTDEEIEYWIGSNSTKKSVARAIEQAVLEKLKQQEPVGAVLVKRESREGVMFYSADMLPDPSVVKDKFELVTVYAAPVPAEDVVKQRDDLLSDVERCYKMLLSEPDTQGALFKAENILREVIAEHWRKGETK